ncbi:polysialyltransferase family glycosyltransferase [Streptomyces sp. NPDC060198]|uniref:polysialyltransferase family glycosyltransferase n=1 Tax=Streptomyces sp. NPDC060198 TaxID=3347070 RepID=UPI0036689AC1
MTVQIFASSGAHGTAVVAAAVDSGCFRDAERRILLLCDTAAVPEAMPLSSTLPGFAGLRSRFDEVLWWNDTVSPLHPAAWTPRADDVPLWERHLRRAWDLGDEEVELVLESPHASPAHAIAEIFTDSPVTVYADGLTGYGPTGGKVSPLIGTRVRQVIHPDLVPGLKPMLLAEYGVPARPLPTAALLKVYTELADAHPGFTGSPGAALLLLPEPETLPADGEAELLLRMVRGAVALGHTRLVLQPHPRAPAFSAEELKAEATRLGAGLTVPAFEVPGAPVPAEVLFEKLRPALVVGFSSTALLSASVHYGLPVARTGTGTLLERLTPYENPARIPVTIVDALLPALDDAAAVRDQSPPTQETVAEALGGLLEAVGFAMRPRVRPDLRPAAERYLSSRLDTRTWRYFKRRRLASLALPGVVPNRLAFVRRSTTLRRVARRARALARR